MSITTGTVSVEDGTKAKEEYAPARKVRVDLTFVLDEYAPLEVAEAVLARTARLARDQVDALLGRVKATDEVSPTTAVEQAGSPVETPKRVRRTAEQMRADDAAKAAAAHAAHSVVEDPDVKAHIEENKADASAVVSDDAAVVSDGEIVPGAWDGDEDWASEVQDDQTVAETPVTDAELNDAVQKKNGELKDPPKIRALIGSFNPDPTKVFQLREVPAERRREFLASLAALK